MLRRERGYRKVLRSPGTVFPGGAVLWLRADRGVTLATGVSSWADQSGTGDPNKNVVQAVAAQQPGFTAIDPAYNGQSTLNFVAANNQFLLSGVWATPLPQPITGFIVGHSPVDGNNRLALDNRAAPQCSSQHNAGTVQNYAGTTLSSAVGWGVPSVVSNVFVGTGSKIYISARTAGASGDAGINGRTGVIVGNYGTIPAVANAWNGSIAEILMYGRLLSNAEHDTVMNYLGARYAIAIGP